MAKRIYRIQFYNQGEIYEVYAKQVAQGGLFGFIEVEGMIFGERSQVVVDPSEEKLKSEFQGVKRTYIPMHAIVRIDEVEREGAAKISDAKGKVTPFPIPFYGPNAPRD
ncbi:MAG: DUF1820 family protein [Xanthomonadaceae bacterium]|nr:DUF1820 family protein [Xanthomonadaceae bacterium]